MFNEVPYGPWREHVTCRRNSSIDPGFQLPKFGIKVSLSLHPFQVLWLIGPKMECLGQLLWQLCFLFAWYCLVLEWENGVNTKEKCEYNTKICRNRYLFSTQYSLSMVSFLNLTEEIRPRGSSERLYSFPSSMQFGLDAQLLTWCPLYLLKL